MASPQKLIDVLGASPSARTPEATPQFLSFSDEAGVASVARSATAAYTDQSHVTLSPTSPPRQGGQSMPHFDTQPACTTSEALVSQIMSSELPLPVTRQSLGQGQDTVSRGVSDIFADADTPKTAAADSAVSFSRSRDDGGVGGWSETGSGAAPLSTSSRRDCHGPQATVEDDASGTPRAIGNSHSPSPAPSCFATDAPLSVASYQTAQPSPVGSSGPVAGGGGPPTTAAGSSGPVLPDADKSLLNAFHTLAGPSQRVDAPATGMLTNNEAVVDAIMHLRGWRERHATRDACGPSTGDNLTDKDRAVFVADPIHFTAEAVELMLQRVAQDARQSASQRGEQQGRKKSKSPSRPSLFRRASTGDREAKKSAAQGQDTVAPEVPAQLPRKVIPTALPSKLDMPLSQRCAFCRQHDSLCAKDHRRWVAIKAANRERIAEKSYARLTPVKRRAMLFLTAAYGSGSFAAMQLFHERERAALVLERFTYPLMHLRVHEENLQEMVDAAGAVRAMHVAAASRNVSVLTSMLESPHMRLLPSSSQLHPVEWMDASLLAKLGKTAMSNFRLHLLDSCVAQCIRRGNGDQAVRVLAALSRVAPDDVRSRWWEVCVLLLKGQYGPCVTACEVLARSTGDVWLAPPVFRGLALLAQKLQQAEAEKDTAVVIDGNNATAQAKPLNASEVVVPTTPPPPPGLQHDQQPVSAKEPPATTRAAAVTRKHISLRRVPFSVVERHLLPLFDAESLWQAHQCSRLPLLREACISAARSLPPGKFTAVLMGMPVFEQLLRDLAGYLPQREEYAPLRLVPGQAPRLLGVLVVHIDSFTHMSVRVSAVGTQLRAKPPARRSIADMLYDALVSSGDESDSEQSPPRRTSSGGDGRPTTTGAPGAVSNGGIPLDAAEVVVSRDFTLTRETTGVAWTAEPSGAWALDPIATERLLGLLNHHRRSQGGNPRNAETST